jgi:hypothetical protein
MLINGVVSGIERQLGDAGPLLLRDFLRADHVRGIARPGRCDARIQRALKIVSQRDFGFFGNDVHVFFAGEREMLLERVGERNWNSQRLRGLISRLFSADIPSVMQSLESDLLASRIRFGPCRPKVTTGGSYAQDTPSGSFKLQAGGVPTTLRPSS